MMQKYVSPEIPAVFIVTVDATLDEATQTAQVKWWYHKIHSSLAPKAHPVDWSKVQQTTKSFEIVVLPSPLRPSQASHPDFGAKILLTASCRKISIFARCS